MLAATGVIVAFVPIVVIATGLAVNAVTIGIWVWSRTSGLPIGAEPDAVEPVGYRDVLATVLEVVLVVVLVATLSERRVPRIRNLRSRRRTPLSRPASPIVLS